MKEAMLQLCSLCLVCSLGGQLLGGGKFFPAVRLVIWLRIMLVIAELLLRIF